MGKLWWALLPVVWAVTVLPVGVLGAAGGQLSWRTGLEFQRALAQPVGILWSDNPLREAVGRLGATYGVAVLLDRRVDPGQRVSVSLQGVPLAAVFEQLARQCGLGVSYFGSVVYLGPPEHTARLRTLAWLRAEEARQLPAPVRRKLLMPRRFGWQELDTPREILQRLAEAADIRIDGLELVPHDLWAGADLPPMSLTDLLTLVVGQFDLTFTFSGQAGNVVLVPISEPVAIERSYPAGRRAAEVARRWSRRFPEAEIHIEETTIRVTAPLEVHEAITGRSGPTPPPRPAPARGEQRYTLRLQAQPVGPVLQQLAARLGLQIQFDRPAIERAGLSLERRISVDLKDVTLDELLGAVAAAGQLEARRSGRVVRVSPAR